MKNTGTLYLIPTTLGETEPFEVLPMSVKKTIEQVNHYIVENEKSARRFIKKISPRKSQPSLQLYILDRFTDEIESQHYLDACFEGIDVGLLSEAGVPGIADPGAIVVKMAHHKNIKVKPLVGPSSIIMAMMASGLNGMNFSFNGYLPIDKAGRKKSIKQLERISFEKDQSQLFIETPYRNEKMFADLKKTLSVNTLLCVAVDITLPNEYIKTMTVEEWKQEKIDLHKRPAIFIIHKQ